MHTREEIGAGGETYVIHVLPKAASPCGDQTWTGHGSARHGRRRRRGCRRPIGLPLCSSVSSPSRSPPCDSLLPPSSSLLLSGGLLSFGRKSCHSSASWRGKPIGKGVRASNWEALLLYWINNQLGKQSVFMLSTSRRRLEEYHMVLWMNLWAHAGLISQWTEGNTEPIVTLDGAYELKHSKFIPLTFNHYGFLFFPAMRTPI